MVENKNIGLKVGLVLFILISIGLCSYLVYDKVLSKNNNINNDKVKNVENKKEENKPTDIKDEYTSINTKDEQVTVAFNYLNVNYFGQENIIKKFYNNKSFSINDLTNEEKMQYVLSAYDSEMGVKSCTDINNSTTINEYTLKKYLKDNSFLEEAKNKNHLLKSDSYDYDYKSGNFLVYMPSCGGALGPQDYTEVKLIGAKKSSKELILTVKFIFNTYNDSTDNDIHIFDTHNICDKNASVIETYKAVEGFEYALDKYNTYDVTFDIDGSNLYLNNIKMQ